METKPEETYRLTGTLPADMIEDLLDDAARLETAQEADYHLCDAVPDIGEDFAQSEIDYLANIVRSMRKSDTKERLFIALEQFENMQARTANSAANTAELIGKARDCLA